MTYDYDRRTARMDTDFETEVSNRHYALVQSGWAELGSKDVRIDDSVKAFEHLFPAGIEFFRRHATIVFGKDTKLAYADMYIDQAGKLRVSWVSRDAIVENQEQAQTLAQAVQDRDTADWEEEHPQAPQRVDHFDAYSEFEQVAARTLRPWGHDYDRGKSAADEDVPTETITIEFKDRYGETGPAILKVLHFLRWCGQAGTSQSLRTEYNEKPIAFFDGDGAARIDSIKHDGEETKPSKEHLELIKEVTR